MKLKVETVDVASLLPYPNNPRKGNIELIAESLRINGQYKPILVQRESNVILAGNHTWQAAQMLEWDKIDIIRLDVDDRAAKKIMLADNRTNDVAVYDSDALQSILDELEGDLEGTGYLLEELDTILAENAERLSDSLETLERVEGEDRSTTLLVASLDAGMPQHEVVEGEVWQVGKHILIIAEPHTDWNQFVPYLTEGKLLTIYPDVFITASEIARENELIMVQPRTYLAGHTLDKHASMFPSETIARLK